MPMAPVRGHDAIREVFEFFVTPAETIDWEVRHLAATGDVVLTERVDRLLAAPIRRRAPARLLREAWSIADRFDWSKTSDAEYIALARIDHCPLVTADLRQLRAASRVIETVSLIDIVG